jgi:aldehyde:ferredoxin oxidoreductase
MKAEPMTGWTGKLLRIDLAGGESEFDRPPREVYEAYMGGRGMAGYYLRDRVKLSWDDPEMPVLLFGGPLVATASPTSGRMTFMSRSPLTGTIADSSVGGALGTHLKRAGLDGVIITGRATRLCGIEIDDGRARIEDARDLAGMGTGRVQAMLSGKGSVAAIGPAAESRCLFANVMVDRFHAAGRNGLGAVLAAKNVKYIAIRGSGRVAVADRAGLKKAREDIFRQIAASPVLLGEHGLTHFGTAALYDLMHARRMMPTDNFRKTFFAKAPSLNAYAFRQRYQPKRAGCRGCHILCKRAAADGGHLPEFETMSHFSALIGNEDMATIVAANDLCGELGMDTITAGATLACYAELSGEKLSPHRVLSLLEDIGRGRGIGRELGKGSYRYAASQGRAELSMSVKKQELPAYDPRGACGMALAYATSNRGGCHLRAYPISHEILRKPVATDRFTFSGKARIIKIAEDMNAAVDSLTACKFVFFASSLEEYSKAYTAVTGLASTAQDLLRIGERIYYNERMMNARNGFSREDDDLPPRFFEEEGTSGSNICVAPLDRGEFLTARANYYRVRGLDADGRPVRAKARELALPWNS